MLKPKDDDDFLVSMIPGCPETAKWYCVVVEPGWTKAVSAKLYALGHRTYIPMQRVWRRQGRKMVATERPIAGLNGYLFVEIDYPRQSFAAVREARGVAEILATGGKPTPFSRDDVLAFLVRQLRGEWDDIEVQAKPPVGAKMIVVEGPQEGKDAIVTATKGKKIFAKVEGDVRASTFFAQQLRAA